MDASQTYNRRALRRQFLAMVARRQQPGSGSRLSLLDDRRAVMDWWTAASRALDDVPHAVGGAVAVNAYAPERNTRDIDLVILMSGAERAAKLLRSAGWRETGPLAIVQGSSWRHPDGYELDLIFLVEHWASDAIRSAQSNIVASMPTLTLPYLTWMKLSAARTLDLADVSRMLGRASHHEVADARALVAQLGNQDDLADFDRLVRMGRLERSGEGDVERDTAIS